MMSVYCLPALTFETYHQWLMAMGKHRQIQNDRSFGNIVPIGSNKVKNVCCCCT